MTGEDQVVLLSMESLAARYETLSHVTNPEAWIRDVLKAFVWSKQREILQSVQDHRYTAVQACHGVGKTYLAALVVAWWISVHPENNTTVMTTAPTAKQVELVLWKEIYRAHQKLMERHKDGSYITGGTQPAWKNRDSRTLGFGRKPADKDENGFQGSHDDYLLVVIDEACGIPKLLYDGVDSVATGEFNRVLAIGNPTDPGSHFKVMCKKLVDWHTIRIDGLQSPNINEAACERYPELRTILAEAGLQPSTEKVPPAVGKSLMSAAYVVEKARMWGTNSSLWQSKVRGEFPDNAMEGVIPLGWCEQAVQRWNEWDEAGRPAPAGHQVISCDVARFGNDATAIALRWGPILVDIKQLHGADTMAVADALARALGPDTLSTPGLGFIIDVGGGLGTGPFDRLAQIIRALNRPHTPTMNAFNGSESPPATDVLGEFGFPNKRSWSWWRMRELLDPSQMGGSKIMLPPDELLMADLCCPTWKITDTGIPPKIVVEKKDDIRDRLGRSPDAGDACTMAFAVSASPRPGAAPGVGAHKWGEREQVGAGRGAQNWAGFSGFGSQSFGNLNGTL